MAYTLDDIRKAAEQKYGAVEIEIGDTTVHLLNPIRLDKDRRKALDATQDKLKDDDEDVDHGEVLSACLRLVAKNDHEADVLLEALGGDLGLIVATFEHYSEATSMGEASASAS